MAKLTKTAAYETAKAMANAALSPKIKALVDEQKKIMTDAAIRAVPAQVRVLYHDNPELQPYFKTQNNFRFKCGELHEDYSYYYTTCEVPKSKNATEYVELTREEYDTMIELSKEISSLSNKRSEIRRKIEATLLSLGTLKRIQKDFPEAFAAIPVKYTERSTETTIALPIDELKEELLKYQS